MTFSELANDLLDGLKSRLKKPYLSAYIIAVLFFNWEAVLVLINSTQPIEDRLHYIHSEYLDLYSYIIFPLVGALVFLLLSDQIMLIQESLTQKAINKRLHISHNRAMLRSRLNTELNQQKYLEEQSVSDFKERKDLNDQLERLRDELESADNQVKSYWDELNEAVKKNDAYESLAEDFTMPKFIDLFPEFGKIPTPQIDIVFKAADGLEESFKIPNDIKLSGLRKYVLRNSDNTFRLTDKGMGALQMFRMIRV